ncbi:MAG: sulfatase-like hydrolase/transferase [Deltaproteobacteria bacterium]|nr:sulfatase-like hydrolase/transferase [Deltaproteobacteria bacterium]
MKHTFLSLIKNIKKLLVLSPKGVVFFFFVVLMHMAFKVCLGLFVTLKDGYGFTSFVAPPQSLLFAASDVVYAFFLVKALDFLPYTRRSILYSVVYVATFLFLLANFVIHMHFKTFLKYSLLMFNGAGTAELTEYFLASVNPFSASFIVIAIVLIAAWLSLGRKLYRKGMFVNSYIPLVVLVVSWIAWKGLDSRLSSGQECWMLNNPTIEFTSSTIQGIRDRYTASRMTAQLKGFSPPPQPVFGDYPASTRIDIPAIKNANVLFLLVESLPANRTILGGDSNSPMKVFDRLRHSAIAFTNVRTVFPATSRSFISYHCGTYPGTGVSTISKYMPKFNCYSIVSKLKDTGYNTAFFTPSMFSYDNLHTTGMMDAYDVKKHFFDFQKKATSSGLLAQAVEEELVAKETLDFMKGSKGPFFALYFSFWTHAPYRLPDRDIGRFDLLERYYLTQAYLDKVYTTLVDDMDAAGLLENTIIVLAADHGEAFGKQHAGNFNHGGMVYDENILIPLFVYVPGLNREVVVDRQGSIVDFAPTLAALLGISPDDSWEGQNLIADAFVAKPHLLFSRSAVVTNGIVDGNLKYFYDGTTDVDHLFDLSTDPTEQHNIAGAHPREVARYRELVDKWLVYQDKKIVDLQAQFKKK